ncbi:MAG TPA: glycosyltransferase family 2 protein [Solimonas sp.]|nr:glycosyltransferase family 2 protein [Solimonas sp.]
MGGLYIPVRWKLALMLSFSALWVGGSLWLALPWVRDLSELIGPVLAWLVVGGLALVPGYANAFLLAGLLFDWRPKLRISEHLPPVTVLIAAYNEEDCIADTLASFARQKYPGELQIIVIDDGSTDRTCERVRAQVDSGTHPANQSIFLLRMEQNGGKAKALNAGLRHARHDLVMTVDADSLLFGEALTHLVSNQLQSPPHTAATAGTVLVRNSRVNLITSLQEWDYFLGIAVVKRVQSLLQGTLVAQGAFSIYRREILEEIGGWQETVGEDIVLTWDLIRRGYRVGYAENAFVFTNVPETYGAYYRQRKRWSRGLIEAFKRYPGMMTGLRLNTPFIWLNFLFPYLDLVYLFAFIPGVIAAVFFQNYAVVGLLTLLLIPLAVACNTLMFFRQRAVFKAYGLRVRRNVHGAVGFTLAYQAILAPASLMGYFAEFFNLRKTW